MARRQPVTGMPTTSIPDEMEFLIITGLSGAGKSLAIHTLEDMGFFCVDNLPPALIPKFAEIIRESQGRISRVALVIDIRGGEFFDALGTALAGLEASGQQPPGPGVRPPVPADGGVPAEAARHARLPPPAVHRGGEEPPDGGGRVHRRKTSVGGDRGGPRPGPAGRRVRGAGQAPGREEGMSLNGRRNGQVLDRVRLWLRWLEPGLGVKRWVALMAGGIFLLSIGV